MNKMFKENGFFSKEGEKLVASFRDELMKLYANIEVANMSEQELHVLQANLAHMVGDMSSWMIQAKKDIDKVMLPWAEQLQNK